MPELFLHHRELALRDGQEPVCGQGDAFFEPQLLFEAVLAKPERASRLRPDIGFEILHVGANRLHRFLARIVEITQQVDVVDVGEGTRQVRVDKRHGAAPRVNANLDENGRRFLDVVACRLHQARYLPQLRKNTTGAIGFRCVAENGLRREARCQGVSVDVRITFPGANRFELELASANVRRHDLVFDLFFRGQVLDGNAVETTAKAREGAHVRVDRRSPVILDQVIVDVDPIHRGAGGVHFVEK